MIKSGNINSFFVLKNSQHGTHYRGEKTQEAITRFVLERLNIYVPEVSEFQWELFLRGKNIVQRPMLIFICDNQQNCFTSDERLIVAATFVSVVLFFEILFTKILRLLYNEQFF